MRASGLINAVAVMLLVASVPYLLLYAGVVPGSDLIEDAGVDPRSTTGLVVASVGALLAMVALVRSVVLSRRRRAESAVSNDDQRTR